LQFESKRVAVDPVLNLIGLNYNNYLDVEESKLRKLEPELVKAHLKSGPLQGSLSDDLSYIAVDLLF